MSAALWAARGWVQAAAALALLSAVACVTPPPGVAPAASASTVAAGAVPVAASDGDSDDEQLELQLPVRRSEAPRAVEPPALPDALQAAPELTLELETRVPTPGGPVSRRENIARGAHRVHIQLDAERIEWLFIQNPVDPRRVSGRLIDHAQRAIIEYDESELRMNGIARGWADVAAFGVGPDLLAHLAPTGRHEARYGFDFAELQPSAGDPAGARIWWSPQAVAPLRITRATPALERNITRLTPGVDPSRLLDPEPRLLGYRVMDVADYREKHHDAEPAGHGQH